VVTDKATFYPSAIRAGAPSAQHTATGFYNLVISTNRCERNHGYVKSRIRPMRGLKSFACATRLFLPWTRCGWSNVTSCECRQSECRALVGEVGEAMSALTALPQSSLGWARPCSTDRTMASATTTADCRHYPMLMSENLLRSPPLVVVPAICE